MKRKTAIVLLIVMLLMLTACQREPKGTAWQHIVKDDEMTGLTIDFDNKTITASKNMVTIIVDDSYEYIGDNLTEEKDVYHYTYENGNITITYPNGATYWESATSTGTVSGWDGDYDTDRYIDGGILAMQLTQAYGNSDKNWDDVVLVWLACIGIAAVGCWMAIAPEAVIELRYGLWFRHVEPTDFAIGATRVSGIVAIAAAVILALVAAFG